MKHLLVIRLGALGDLLHLSPSLTAVKAAFPDLSIHLLTGPAYQALGQALPGVDRVWTLDKKAGWSGLLALGASLRAAGIDGVVNLHPAFKTWALSQLLRVPSQSVYRKQKLTIKGQAQRALPRRHAATDFYRPFQRLLALPDPETLIPRLPAAGLPARPRKLEGERWIGLIPGVGAKRANRAWEPSAYAALIGALLADPAVRVLLVGGPDEKPLAETLMLQSPLAGDRLQNHCGAHDILSTAGLLRQCDGVIGGDTGPLHLAAAVGVPIVAIYGPTSLARTGPLGDQPMRLLTPPEALSCWPCEAPVCPLSGADHLACMRQISASDVLAAYQALFA